MKTKNELGKDKAENKIALNLFFKIFCAFRFSFPKTYKEKFIMYYFSNNFAIFLLSIFLFSANQKK